VGRSSRVNALLAVSLLFDEGVVEDVAVAAAVDEEEEDEDDDDDDDED
jgi:hypothetical protein